MTSGGIILCGTFWIYCACMIAYAEYATRKANNPFRNSGTRL